MAQTGIKYTNYILKITIINETFRINKLLYKERTYILFDLWNNIIHIQTKVVYFRSLLVHWSVSFEGGLQNNLATLLIFLLSFRYELLIFFFNSELTVKVFAIILEEMTRNFGAVYVFYKVNTVHKNK